MDPPLLKTKLAMPLIRANLVARPKLYKRLTADLPQEAGFGRKLTLVSAPAGYGKTTIVTQWLDRLPYPVAWLSLDEKDDDPARFLAYLIAALSNVQANFGTKIRELLASPQSPPQDMLTAVLINEITDITEFFVIALDDYQLLGNSVIHQLINTLIENQPTNLHLVIATREDPPFPLSKLRARGQVIEIRQSDLQFSPKEVVEFLSKTVSIGNLDQEDIRALTRRTEGWAVGLQMTALSMQGVADLVGFVRSFTGSNRYILDYLFDEVFSKQPEDVQKFLLQTSILSQLCGPLCDALTGRNDGEMMLHKLESANLFLFSLDDSGTWYRYHLLFSDLLAHRLRISSDLKEADLHLQAANWLAENGHIYEAIEHALRAGDWDQSGELIKSVSAVVLRRGEVTTLLGWYRKFPREQIHSRPWICIEFSWPLILSGQLSEAEGLLDVAETGFTGEDSLQLGEIATARAYIARSLGDHQDTIRTSERALELIPEGERLTRSVIAVNLGIAYWHDGQIKEAERVFKDAQPYTTETKNYYAEFTCAFFRNRILAARGDLQEAYQGYQRLKETERQIPILALVYLDLSGLNYEWNQLELCETNVLQSIEVSLRTHMDEFQIAGLMQMVRLKLASGDMGMALHSLQKVDRLLQEHTVSALTRSRVASLHVMVALAQSDLDGAIKWAENAGQEADVHPFYPFMGLTPARLYMAQNEKALAWRYLDEIGQKASVSGWGYGCLAAKIMQLLSIDPFEDALKRIKYILQDAESEHFIRTFVDFGEPLVPLLVEAARQGVTPGYIGDIMRGFRGTNTTLAGSGTLVEPLSDREIEVLRLVVAGLSNREIADQLVISLGTVKTHIHNVYGKLGVASRAQAIVQARERNLV